jgi:hypothetical protein
MSNALEKCQENIEIQQKKLIQLKAKEQAIKAREKAKIIGKEKAKDTRRKVLAGAFFLHAAKDNPANTVVNGKTLDQFLTRKDERALFGLV